MGAELIKQRFRLVLPAALRLVAIGVVATVAGALFGAVAGLWVALVAVTLLLAVHLFYLSALGQWLNEPRLATIPDGIGVWSEIFTRLYRARRATEGDARRLRDNEERFRRTISALPEGIVLVDEALQIEWCNPVAERHLGIRLGADQGRPITNLVRDPAFVAHMSTGSYAQPLMFRPLGNPTLMLSVARIEFEPGRSILISRDVTQTERVDAMRRDFVANVSHELRTPLTVVNGFLETLLDAQPPLDATRAHHLQLMHEQAARMHRLVEDLLMLSRLESTETLPAEEEIDVPRLVRDLEAEARLLSHGRHAIAVEIGAARVRGSRDELRSAFGNLVSNAIRYTPAGGRITLRWRACGDGAQFEVEDTGIGVSPENIPRLTERFYRVDKSRSRETGGTGLGLAIVKHVLLRHQGRLEIQSEVGKGSRFIAWLPRARVIDVAAEAQHAA
jgi:two-component system phosphate regulon sensor histidine kinase PhoR